jgi:hypothetical protein
MFLDWRGLTRIGVLVAFYFRIAIAATRTERRRTRIAERRSQHIDTAIP